MLDSTNSFNPPIGLSNVVGYVRGMLYDLLIRVSAGGTYIPWLAESYTVDSEKLADTAVPLRQLTAPSSTFNLIIASNHSGKRFPRVLSTP